MKAQALADTSFSAREEWKYTQNWISYEIGLACMTNIDVWVICDNVKINFPVPYLNNYEVIGIQDIDGRKWYRTILEDYSKNRLYPLGEFSNYLCNCPYEGCGTEFNFWSNLKPGAEAACPTCLKPIRFNNGWPPAPS